MSKYLGRVWVKIGAAVIFLNNFERFSKGVLEDVGKIRNEFGGCQSILTFLKGLVEHWSLSKAWYFIALACVHSTTLWSFGQHISILIEKKKIVSEFDFGDHAKTKSKLFQLMTTLKRTPAHKYFALETLHSCRADYVKSNCMQHFDIEMQHHHTTVRITVTKSAVQVYDWGSRSSLWW